jgi:hypothetical protein
VVKIPPYSPKVLSSNFLLNYNFIHKQNGWKKIPEIKRGLSCSWGNNHVPKEARFKLPQEATMFLKEKKLLLFENMIIPKEKNCSPKQLKLLLLENMIDPKETYVSNFSTITIIS